ncbi:MAG: pyridoxal-dependent decarboxylase [Planctomycetota bacterium]
MIPELAKAAALAADYLQRLPDARVAGPATLDALRQTLDVPLTDVGVSGEHALDELARDIAPGLLTTAGGRFFGWVIGSSTPATIGADWLCSAWDQNTAAFACSPGASVVEDVAGRWLKEILGLPEAASFSFVTGCQMAHFVGLAAARHQLLAQADWNVEERGLCGAPRLRVLVGEYHETLVRAVRYLGLGSDAIVPVGCDDRGAIDLARLAQALTADDGAPTIVSLAAGDLNRGVFDDFDRACDVAHEHQAWVHVDGAFGLWVGASPTHRHLVRGIEKADSWATDAHKWLNVPYENGMAFVAHPDAHRRAMSVHADYVIDAAGGRDQMNWNPEWSRRARAIPIYVALRTMGRKGVADLVDACCALTVRMVDGLAAVPGVEVLARPIINQALVRFPAAGDVSDEAHNERTDRVIQQIQRDGHAWFGPTTWRGMRVMRISVSSWRTTAEDVDCAVAAVGAALRAVR